MRGLCVVGTGPCWCGAGSRGWLVFSVLGVEMSSHIVLADFDALTIVEPAYEGVRSYWVGEGISPVCGG